jgi:hypothetical protein
MEDFKKLFSEKINTDCQCKKCKCDKCGAIKTQDGRPAIYQNKRNVQIAPNHYRLYDIFKCRVCNYQWIEQLNEQKYETFEPMEIKN